MSDELTPDERKALDSLPRERMPAGLEERVVGAMREHGFLERRRRMIVLTNARVAGLLAACVALVIGAYSVGLHHGATEKLLPVTETPRSNELDRMDQPLARAPLEAREEKAEPLASGSAGEAERNAPEKPLRPARTRADELRKDDQAMASDAGKSKTEDDAAPSPATPIRSEETVADEATLGAHPQETPAGRGDLAESPMAAAPAPAATLNESAAKKQSMQARETPLVSQIPLTFILNGTPLIVEAPDSVRVVRDEQGRMLLIYTSDGIIRIRIGDR